MASLSKSLSKLLSESLCESQSKSPCKSPCKSRAQMRPYDTAYLLDLSAIVRRKSDANKSDAAKAVKSLALRRWRGPAKPKCFGGGGAVDKSWVDCDRATVKRRYDRLAKFIPLFDR